MTSASDFSADPVGVVDETQIVKVAPGRDDAEGAAAARRLPLPDALPRRPRRRTPVGPAAALHLRPAADRPARLQGRLPVLRRASSTGSGTPGVHGPDVDDRPVDRPPLPRQPGPAYNDAKVADGAERDRRRPQARPLRLGRRPRRGQPRRLPHDRRHASPQASFEWLAQETERQRASPQASTSRCPATRAGTTAGASTPRGGWSTTRRTTATPATRPSWTAGSTSCRARCGWFESHAGADGLFDVPGRRGRPLGLRQLGQGELRQRPLRLRAGPRGARGGGRRARRTWPRDWRRQGAPNGRVRINATLYDGTAYIVAPDDSTHAQDGNAMALLAGVATGDRATRRPALPGGLNGPFGPLTVDRPAAPCRST